MASFSNRELRDAMREMSVEPAGVKETVTDRLDSAKDTLLKASQGLKTQLAEARLGEKGANALRSASAVSASAAAAASAQMQRLKMGWSALSSSKTAASDSSAPAEDSTADEGGKPKSQHPAATSSGGADDVVRGAVVEGEEDEEDEDEHIDEASRGGTAERSSPAEKDGGSGGGSSGGMVAGSMVKSLSGAWAALVPSEETMQRSKALLASATASAAVLPSLAFSHSSKGSGSGGDGAAEGDDPEGGETAKGQSQATTASDVAASGSTWAAELKGLSEFLANDFKTFRDELQESSLSLLELGAARMAWSVGPVSGSALLLATMEQQWHDIDALQAANDIKMQAASEVLRKLVVAWMKTTANYDACEAELRRTAGVSEQLRELTVKVEGIMESVQKLDVAMAEAETAKHTAELLQKHARFEATFAANETRHRERLQQWSQRQAEWAAQAEAARQAWTTDQEAEVSKLEDKLKEEEASLTQQAEEEVAQETTDVGDGGGGGEGGTSGGASSGGAAAEPAAAKAAATGKGKRGKKGRGKLDVNAIPLELHDSDNKLLKKAEVEDFYKE